VGNVATTDRHVLTGSVWIDASRQSFHINCATRDDVVQIFDDDIDISGSLIVRIPSISDSFRINNATSDLTYLGVHSRTVSVMTEVPNGLASLNIGNLLSLDTTIQFLDNETGSCIMGLDTTNSNAFTFNNGTAVTDTDYVYSIATDDTMTVRGPLILSGTTLVENDMTLTGSGRLMLGPPPVSEDEATVDASTDNFIILTNTTRGGDWNVSGISGGSEGQILVLSYFETSPSGDVPTIRNNAIVLPGVDKIFLAGGTHYVMANTGNLTLIYYDGAWYETARMEP